VSISITIPGAYTPSMSQLSLRNATSYKGVSKSFRSGLLEPELQMIQFSATRYNSIAILWAV